MFLFVNIDSDEVDRATGRKLQLKSLLMKYTEDENQSIQPHVIRVMQNFVRTTSSSSYIFKVFFMTSRTAYS